MLAFRSVHLVLAWSVWFLAGVALAQPPVESTAATANAAGIGETTPASSEPAAVGNSETPVASAGAATNSSSGTEPNLAELWLRAENIERLAAGHLAADVDLGELLRVDLVRGDVDAMALLQAVTGAPPPKKRVRPWKAAKQPPQSLPLPNETDVVRDRLLRAQAAWLQLSVAHRRAAIEFHEKRVADRRQDGQRRESLITRVTQLENRAHAIEQLLAGKLDPAVDPDGLLHVDLGDELEWLSAAERRARFEAANTEPASGGDPSPGPTDDSGAADTVQGPPPAPTSAVGEAASEPAASSSGSESGVPSPSATLKSLSVAALEARVVFAETRLDRARARVIALDPAARAKLLSDHASRGVMVERARVAARTAAEQIAAEQAAAEEQAGVVAQRIELAQDAAALAAAKREAALEAARQAKSEARRIIAEDQARLLGVSEAQALFDAALGERRAEMVAEHDSALERARRSNDLAASVEAFRATADAADTDYEQLRDALTAARERLDAVLRQIAGGESDIPEIGAAAANPGGDIDRTELEALYARVVDENERLRQLEEALAWELATTYRDDIVLLNTARLRLLESTTSQLRARVTGFGAAGVRQAARELEQIGLELRYQALSLPRFGRELLADFETSPIPVVWGIAQIVFAITLLRWWRRRAPTVLEALQQRLGDVRYPTRVSRFSAATVWYATRVRKPLELLAVLWFLARTVRSLVELSQLELLWLVAEWLLIGSAIVLWIDAIAARDTHAGAQIASERAKLRFRSLRLIGLNIVVVGLLLSMAEVLVGQGAIYGWVMATCWFLAVPIVVVLVGWWRKYVFAGLEAQQHDRFARWALQHNEGVFAFVMAGLGGAYLVSRGVALWVMRRLYDLDVTRRLLAYLFRREVAKQAVATGASENLRPIADEVRARMLEFTDAEHAVSAITDMQRETMREIIATPRTTIAVVVAERGMGKSTFLRQLASEVEQDVLIVECPAGGFGPLMAQLATSLGANGSDEAAVIDALSTRGPTVVCVDDLQRLVRPVVGGLAGLDQLGELARQVGAHVSWIITMGTPAWQYVQRARGDRLFFDHVTHLSEWSEEQIAALLVQRTETVGLDPSFDGLVVPRRYDASSGSPDEDRGEQGFYRILWDYADGNPRVASLFWAESLFYNASQQLVVRLFKEPSLAELDALALPIRFVLRSLVQLEVATVADLTAAVGMSPAEAADALRFTVAHGYVERHADVYLVTWFWYRAVTNMLRRQHLLAS